ncbi:MAG: sugar phosphate isomerase/epimerase [Armatimonadetes bacterium]|nr:sugar phosphate isomerase/epimerase [Armatimonadota bacterium]
MRYSATSVMMPELTLEEQAALLRRLGFDGIEWRVRRVSEEQRGKGYSEWGEHKNDLTPENFLDNAPRMRQVAADHGLAIAGIASNAPADDVQQVKLLAEGAKACGAPFIRVGCPHSFDGRRDYNELYAEAVEAYEAALNAISGLGLKFALEIHGGTIHPSASLAHRIVSNWDPARVCAIFDPNNMVADGFETTEIAIDLLGHYLGHVHLGGHKPVEKERDESSTMQWEWEGAALADGLYNHPRLLRKLKAVGYRGFITVEDFRQLPIEEKLAEGLAYLKQVEAGL